MAGAVVALALLGCEEPVELTLPTTEQVEAAYASAAELEEVGLSGNVAHIVIRQSPDQLRRGGSLWARVGPYIYLFSDETRGRGTPSLARRFLWDPR
jgi:hypothetical protein